MNLERSVANPRLIWWRDVFQRWPVYLAGLVAMFVTNGTEVLAPKTIQWMIDALISASNQSSNPQSGAIAFQNILNAAALFVVVALVGLAGRIFWRFTLARMTHVAGASMKQNIWSALRSSSLENVQRFTLGDLMNRAIGDVNSARWIYGFTLVLTCDVIFFTSLGAISMLLIHPGLALACLSTFVIFPPIIMQLAKREYMAHESAQSELTTLSEYVSQAIRGVRSQRASHAFGSWVTCLADSAARYAKLRFKAQTIAINSFPVCSIPTMASYVILFFWGPQLVTSNLITVGEFAAMASYVYLLQGPVADVGELVAEWQKGFASVNRIAEITHLPEQNRSAETLADRVRIKTIFDEPQSMDRQQDALMIKQCAVDVSGLKAVRGGRVLFEGVSLKLARSEWLGISGDVGSGKSTFLQNLAGLLPPNEGRIRFNGHHHPAEQPGQTISDGLCQVAYAPEKPFVFAGTIRHNLALNHTYSDGQIWRSLEIVGLDAEVRNIPRGLDGVVGEGGVSLSGGQRQRLALARIVLRASGVVLLDDPLSAVDGETESKIISNLKQVWSSHSVIWASNKPSTLTCCDRIGRLTVRGLEFIDGPDAFVSGKAQEELHV
jgi:ATP-binding cassette subfamily B multidrug efflux pump